MKKFGVILSIFAAAGLSYFAWGYFNNSTSDTVIAPSGKNKIVATGKNLQGNILDSGKKQLESAKSFAENISGQAGNAFNGLIDGAKNTLKEQLDSILETTSSPSSSLALAPVAVKPSIVSGTAQNSSAEALVCFVVSKGESIEYGIDQPFAGAAATSYKIDWGDGQGANGVFHAGDQNVVVSHSYSQSGTFPVVFQLTSSSTTLTASRSVCVK